MHRHLFLIAALDVFQFQQSAHTSYDNKFARASLHARCAGTAYRAKLSTFNDSLETISACGYHKTMVSHYSKLFAVFLFALLQCFAPLLHAHLDTKTHGLSGAHQHEAVELYCLDTEKSHCPEDRVEALDSVAITIAPASPKKFPPTLDPAILASGFSPWPSQAHGSFVAIPPASGNILRLPFASPLAHAPPSTL